jgi:hypothetical protein
MPEITAKKWKTSLEGPEDLASALNLILALISKFKGESNISIMSVETLLSAFINGQLDSLMLYVYTYDRQLQLSCMGR